MTREFALMSALGVLIGLATMLQVDALPIALLIVIISIGVWVELISPAITQWRCRKGRRASLYRAGIKPFDENDGY